MNNDKFSEIKQGIFDYIDKETMKVCEDNRETQNALESFDHYCSRQIQQQRQNMEIFIKFVEQGFENIVTSFLHHGDHQALTELQQGISKFMRELSHKPESIPWEKLPTAQQSIASTFGYSEKLLEKIYQIGTDYYHQHKLSEAGHVFALLNLLDPTHFSAWLSLGIVLEQEKKWEQSLETLKVACQLEQDNPLAHLHEAICYGHLNNQQEAQAEFETALALANAQPAYADYVDEIKSERGKLGSYLRSA